MKVLIEKGASGKPTLVVEKGRKRYPVYSRHDPERDGMRFHARYGAEGVELYLFIGLGLGYHITPFLHSPAVKRAVILEPDEGLLRKVEGCEGVRNLLTHAKVEFHSGTGVNRFIESLKGRYGFLFFSGYRVLAYPTLRQIFPGPYADVENRLNTALSLLTNDALTIGRFARLWMNNVFRNLAEPGAVHPISELFGRWNGTAVVAGAGPSLSATFTELAMARSRIYLIAADAALKPLVRHGIRPDLVVSCDPQPSEYYHISGLRGDKVRDIPAVLNPLGYPELFRLFETRYLYFTLHPTTEFLLPLIRNDTGLIINYTSVSALAFHLAVAMGFETICLAGLDFTYTGMHAYAWDTFFYDYCVLFGSRFRTPYSVEADVLKRQGEKKLGDYRSELEILVDDPAREREVRVLNLSCDGYDIRGAERIAAIPDAGNPVEAAGVKEGLSLAPALASLCTTEHLSAVTETLALRNRLYRHAPSRDLALQQAEKWISKKCARFGKRF